MAEPMKARSPMQSFTMVRSLLRSLLRFGFVAMARRGVRLVATHNGESIDPPDPEQNILLILGDTIARGHFEPMDDAKFQQFLSQKQEFTVAGLELFSKEGGGDIKPEEDKKSNKAEMATPRKPSD
ncbi:hypothetical protein HZ994_11210 [Akkermansiaceae bacterium]|nr:hypothetical protein HZ994_11210 [Akkermansiaceae bacterium]